MVMAEVSRRSFLGGLIALVAAPAIVRATSLMPIKVLVPEYVWVPGQVLEDALDGFDFQSLRYGDMFMLMKRDADRLATFHFPHPCPSPMIGWRYERAR